MAHRAESIGLNTPPSPLTTLLAADEACLGQDARVVRDRRLTATQRTFKVAAAAPSVAGDDRHQPETHRV